jgi:hypothetical protein
MPKEFDLRSNMSKPSFAKGVLVSRIQYCALNMPWGVTKRDLERKVFLQVAEYLTRQAQNPQ